MEKLGIWGYFLPDALTLTLAYNAPRQCHLVWPSVVNGVVTDSRGLCDLAARYSLIRPKTSAAMKAGLPVLYEKPVHHAACCLSLSTPLLIFLHDTITNIDSTRTHCVVPAPTNAGISSIPSLPHQGQPICLSIGSGTGLLEALLQQQINNNRSSEVTNRTFLIRGVEVASAAKLNCYLYNDVFDVVPGAWATFKSALDPDVKAWLFMYPRQPTLVLKYTEMLQARAERADQLMRIVWAGPRADWSDYEEIFQGLSEWCTKLLPGNSCGLLQWECVAVIERQVAS